MSNRSLTALKTAQAEGGSTILDQQIEYIKKALGALDEAVTNETIVEATFAVAATDQRVYHNLGTVPVAWEIVDRTADANVWRSPTTNPLPARYLILRSSAPVTVKVRFST